MGCLVLLVKQKRGKLENIISQAKKGEIELVKIHNTVWWRLRLVGVKLCLGLKRECSSRLFVSITFKFSNSEGGLKLKSFKKILNSYTYFSRLEESHFIFNPAQIYNCLSFVL